MQTQSIYVMCAHKIYTLHTEGGVGNILIILFLDICIIPWYFISSWNVWNDIPFMEEEML